MIEKIRIKNYRKFRDLTLPLNSDLNVVVGDNDSGKSTILEAINLALSFKINGRFAGTELNSFLFHQPAVQEYVTGVQTDKTTQLPEMAIELFLLDRPDLARLKGSMNSLGEDKPGIKVLIRFNDSFSTEYQDFLAGVGTITTIPIEYYEVKWYSFADEEITSRSVPLSAVVLDTTSTRLQNGADSYVRSVIDENLDAKQRAGLALSFRGLRESFFGTPAIAAINVSLNERKGDVTAKDFEVSLDVSQRNAWESHLVPYLDKIPLHYSGMGERNSLKLLLGLNKDGGEASVVLVEELENHLSFSTMAQLLTRIREKCNEKQVVITTHSTYVLNKLGLDHLILLGTGDQFMRLSSLSKDTREYFERLPGYDTLRMILAKRSILVEGPSDELIVQRAYRDLHGKLPIEDGIDVICVRGLSFKRFLDIAKLLGTSTTVVTDNDGSYQTKIVAKYRDYEDISNIKICASDDDALKTLEPQLVAVNELAVLNAILEQEFATKDLLLDYMSDSDNKTDCALKIFSSATRINYPAYLTRALG
jgi:energy-coupling factor transporter ATP-binding protein EcfA2